MSPEGGRVLGCLIEKQLATPQQYPLTLNGLTLACNQSTSREPVMNLSEQAVRMALDELKALRLVRFVMPSHGKSVVRYRHVFDEVYGLDTSQMAVLSVLLLRGPQTPGEIRAHIGRMASFDSVDALQRILEALSERPEPLAQLLPRRQGQKEDRWQQLIATEVADVAGVAEGTAPAVPEGVPIGQPAPPGSAAVSGTEAGNEPDETKHGTDLESRVETLQSELAALRNQVTELATSFNELRETLGG